MFGNPDRSGARHRLVVVVFVEFGEEFVGVVGEFDFGWSGAVGPGESAGVGDFFWRMPLLTSVWSGPQPKNKQSASVRPSGTQSGSWWASQR